MEGQSTTQTQEQTNAPIFVDLSQDESPTEITSLCMNCHEQGVTRLLLTKIPFFREIILMAFSCKHCGWRSNEIQFGGQIQEKGSTYKLIVTDKKDLDRQVVKSDSARILVPELELEIPPITQKGSLNTIEGFLVQTIDALRAGQQERMAEDPETAKKVEAFLGRVEACKEGQTLPFTFIVDDPAGNSFIENPYAPNVDPNLTVTHYERTHEQNRALAISDALKEDFQQEEEEEEEEEEEKEEEEKEKEMDKETEKGKEKENENKTGKEQEQEKEKETEKVQIKGSAKHGAGTIISGEEAEAILKKQEKPEEELEDVMRFPETCSICSRRGETRMCLTDIPHFKQVVIMSFLCKGCGYKSNEVKAGGAIPAKGKKITLRVTNPTEDLNRDILKSETSGLIIPELELELTPGTLGGKFTTVEGLLSVIRDDLKENPFTKGDSSTPASRQRMNHIISQLDEMIAGKQTFTLVLDDPVANSYIQNYYAPDDDPNMIVEEYERTWAQNEELGLNDINTENYEQES
jgi:zinc finger protein